jgi:arylsulfatase
MSKLTRRDFIGQSVLMTVGVGAAASIASAQAKRPTTRPPATRRRASDVSAQKLNILFVFTDQERYFKRFPTGFVLPGRERLQKTGVAFHNHYCPAIMCTSSRAVIFTGLQTADNRMFENVDVPWVKDLSPSVPTFGHMLRKAGYYTAYKGKWHLNRTFDQENADRLMTADMEAYGFADYNSPGDLVGHQLGGYRFDHLIAGSAVTWLRNKGRPLSDEGKPWALAVSLVNPHDVMYFNTDAPGQKVQDNGHLMKRAVRAPEHQFYRKEWDLPVPASLKQSFEGAGRPSAHGEFLKVWDYVLGHVPLEEERWRRLNNFYLNSLRAVDLQLLSILKELDALNLSERTIIVVTSDHGEMAGAHGGLRGKGPTPYEECIHLPLHIVHPDVRGGQDCKSISGHIDIAPTLLSFAGVKAGGVGELAGRELPGKDLSAALQKPGTAPLNAVREGALFAYSGLITVDSDPLAEVLKELGRGKDLQTALRGGGKPNLKKRGTVRSVVDGRHKFTRYFAPVDRNRPQTIDQLYANNDVELFDLQTDPSEMTNLAAIKGQNRELVMKMSAKLEAVIKDEIGVDDGREMPDLQGMNWTLQSKGNETILD